MAADNVYDEDQEYLIEARDTISELEDLKDKLEEIKLLQKKNKRAIVREERATGDEISATLKKRKEQIAASYDRQIDVNNSKIRQVQTKKDKKKSQRMEDRINKETADIREENRQLNATIKTLFKKNHVPPFCNTKMYYCLFSSVSRSDFNRSSFSFLRPVISSVINCLVSFSNVRSASSFSSLITPPASSNS